MLRGWLFLFLFSLCSAAHTQPVTKQYCEKMTNVVQQIAQDHANGMDRETFLAKLGQSMESMYQKEGSILQDMEDVQLTYNIAIVAYDNGMKPEEAETIFLPICMKEVPKLQNKI